MTRFKQSMVLAVAVFTLFLAPFAALAADAVLTWNANTDADLAGYRVYFSQQSCSAQGPLAPLVVGGSPVQVALVTTYRHLAIPSIDGTLCWEITAFDTSGNESAHSARVSKTVNLVPPPAPTGFGVAIQ